MNVCNLLAHSHFCCNFSGSAYEAHSHTGGEDLGERAAVNNDSVCIERFDRGEVFASKSQFTVRVVLKDNNAVFFSEFVYFLALFKGHGNSHGVLECGDRVNKLRSGLGFENFFKSVRVHAVLVHGNAAETCFVSSESIERSDEAGLFADNNIVFVAKNFTCQVDTLLTACEDEKRIVVCADIEF